MQAGTTIAEWLQTLAAKQPTPGGGSVAALHAATASGLVGMVSIYTTGPKWPSQTKRMQEIHTEAGQLRLKSLQLMEDDVRAFRAVGDAYKLPKLSDSDKQTRTAAIQLALVGAAQPPVAIIALSSQIIALVDELAVSSNPAVMSDVAVAASTTSAAIESALMNVIINQKSITDKTIAAKLSLTIQQAEALLVKTEAIVTHVRQNLTS